MPFYTKAALFLAAFAAVRWGSNRQTRPLASVGSMSLICSPTNANGNPGASMLTVRGNAADTSH